MIGGAGFAAGVAHAEGFDRPVHLAVEVHLAHVAVVGVDDEVRVVGLAQPIQGAQLGLNGDARVDGGDAQGLAVEVFVQAVGLDVFFGFAETHAQPGPQTDLLAAGALLNYVLDGAEHLRVGLTAVESEAVVGSQNIHRAARGYLGHVHLGQGGLGLLADDGHVVGAAGEDHRRQAGNQVGEGHAHDIFQLRAPLYDVLGVHAVLGDPGGGGRKSLAKHGCHLSLGIAGR